MPRRCRPRPPLRGDRAVGPGHRGDAAPHPRSAAIRSSRSTSTIALGKIYDEQLQDAGAGRGVPGRGAVARPGARADDGGAARPLLAARRLAEGGADDGARRGCTPSIRSRRRACCSRPANIYQDKLADETQAEELYARVIAARSRARRGGRAAGRDLLPATSSGRRCRR